jgi:uncharacterized protein YecT (DUF1311 family)
MRRLAIFLLIAAAACAAAQEQKDASAPAAKICASVENLRVPTVTPESPADASWLKSCREDDLYYGVSPHQDVDYPAARRCALYAWNAKHGPAPGDLNVSGDVYDFSTQTLVMIFANGDGVPRNLDLAMHIACQEVFPLQNPESDYQSELIQVILGLAKMKSAAAPERFDYCNGGAQLSDWPEKLVCKSIDTRLARKKREAHLAELVAPWTGEQKDAFSRARAAYSQFEELEERFENTCAVPVEMCTMDIDDRLETEFAANIDSFEQGKLPAFTHHQYGDANYALNALYQQTLDETFHSPGNLRVTIRDAERVWLAFRDAFVEFAKLRWPSVSGDSWLTFLDNERMTQLKNLPIQ